MSSAVIYIHGKGGNAGEADRYKPLFPQYNVIGFDYSSQTPWEAVGEFPSFWNRQAKKYDQMILIANSIGAYFSLVSLGEAKIEKAFFVSPILNMEKLICDMMAWANVTEAELCEKKKIPTAFGEPLSWEYLSWVRSHPVKWSIPTEILYGGLDNLQSYETVRIFARKHHAAVTCMEKGEHWFHTDEQMAFLDNWLRYNLTNW